MHFAFVVLYVQWAEETESRKLRRWFQAFSLPALPLYCNTRKCFVLERFWVAKVQNRNKKSDLAIYILARFFGLDWKSIGWHFGPSWLDSWQCDAEASCHLFGPNDTEFFWQAWQFYSEKKRDILFFLVGGGGTFILPPEIGSNLYPSTVKLDRTTSPTVKIINSTKLLLGH